jgi:hypothetical protein
MLMEQYLPTFDVRDYHKVRVVASADTAYAVLHSLDLHCSWIVQALFAIRSPPELPTGPHISARRPLAVGWVLLKEAPGCELVAGAVTQPWRPVVQFCHALRLWMRRKGDIHVEDQSLADRCGRVYRRPAAVNLS